MEEDGPTMAYLILDEVQPETTVSVSVLKDELASVNLAKFSHNIKDMLDHMKSLYEEVLENNTTHNDIIHTFRALPICSNPGFFSVLCSRKDARESGTTYTFDSLKSFAIKKYNNLVKENVWGEVGPKYAKIMALATQIQTISTLFEENKKSAHLTNNNLTNDGKKKVNIDSWCKVKTSRLVERDRKKWY